METTLTKISDVEYELEIRAEAEELKPELDKALKIQRGRTQAKGFRPGKVPMSLVKKLYGEALAYGVAEKHVQEVYEKELLDNDDYAIIGQPTLTELDFSLDSDLRAVIQFGVRPEFELEDLSTISLPKLKVNVTEDEIEEQLQAFRRSRADLVPTEEPAGEGDQVVFDSQELDLETDTPVIGMRDEAREVFLDDDLTAVWKDSLMGRKAGDTFRVDIPHGEGEHSHIHRFEISVREVKNRDLPDLDDETVAELTDGNMESVDELRERLTEELVNQTEQQSQKEFESGLIDRLLELHPIPVPRQAVDIYLDSYVEDLKRRNNNELPENFDEVAFRERSYKEAESQARWMLIRDHIIETESFEVSDEDLEAYFQKMETGEDFSAQMMRQYYDQLGMTDSLTQQLLNERIFEWLEGQVQVEELEFDDYVRAVEEERKAKQESANTTEVAADDDTN